MPDQPAPPPVVLLDTAEAIAARAPALAAAPVLPIDLESNGLHAYQPSLCTLQIGVVGEGGQVREVLVVDPMRAGKGALAPLAPALAPTGPRKILHDLAFDARILARAGLPLGNAFDTALAARFLGVQSVGLAALLADRFGVAMSKALQHHDWGRRPLDPKTFPYLALDVAYLPALAGQLEAELAKQGIGEDLRVEIEYRLENALASDPDADPRPPYVRIKQADGLGPLELAVLRRLAEVRERTAAKWDRPPFKVVGNEVLVEAAKVRPASLEALGQVKGVPRARPELMKELFEALQAGIADKDVPAEERKAFLTPPPRPPREQVQARRAREQRLSAWRKAEAARRKVDEQAVLPGHCLQDIADAAPASREELEKVRGLGKHRLEASGEGILKAVKG